jgi:hypothetical protein
LEPHSVLLGTLTGFVLVKLDTLLGVTADSAVPTVLRLTYLGIFLAGMTWAQVRRTRRPGGSSTFAETPPAT